MEEEKKRINIFIDYERKKYKGGAVSEASYLINNNYYYYI